MPTSPSISVVVCRLVPCYRTGNLFAFRDFDTSGIFNTRARCMLVRGICLKFLNHNQISPNDLLAVSVRRIHSTFFIVSSMQNVSLLVGVTAPDHFDLPVFGLENGSPSVTNVVLLGFLVVIRFPKH